MVQLAEAAGGGPPRPDEMAGAHARCFCRPSHARWRTRIRGYFQHPENERFRARAVRDGERIPAQPAKPRFWIFPSCSIEFAVQSWALFGTRPTAMLHPMDDTTAD